VIFNAGKKLFLNRYTILQMSSSDAEEISNLFDNVSLSEKSLYRDVQYVQLNDLSIGSYSSGLTQFDTTPFKSNPTIMSESYLIVPTGVTCTTGGSDAISGATQLAVKNSILSMISGIAIQTTNGTMIQNTLDGSLPIINNLKLHLRDINFVRSTGESLSYFGPDRSTAVSGQGNAPPANTQVPRLQGTNPSVASRALNVGDNYNSDAYTCLSLANRISVMQTNARITGSGPFTWSYIAFIPLKFLSDFFEKMNFPIVNLAFQISFYFANSNNNANGNYGYTIASTTAGANVPTANVWGTTVTGQQPWAGSEAVSGSTAGLVTVAANGIQSTGNIPTITMIPGTATEKSSSLSQCRLMLKTVTLNGPDLERWTQDMRAGMTKTITWTDTQIFTPSNTMNQAGGTAAIQINGAITQSIVRPLRVWAFALQAGALRSPGTTFPACCSDRYLYNTNIQVNGVNFYQAQLQTQMDHYRILRDQMPEDGSLISYQDFLVGGCNFYCFDLSRAQALSKNDACSLYITTTIGQSYKGGPNNAGDLAVMVGATDLVFLIEKAMTTVLNLSDNNTTVYVSQGLTSGVSPLAATQ
jgi:hypothetical protein